MLLYLKLHTLVSVLAAANRIFSKMNAEIWYLNTLIYYETAL